MVTRRSAAAATAVLIAACVVFIACTVRVPLVALGPGPIFDTLGEVKGTTVVAINGLPTYPTTGNLSMTTVGLSDNLTIVDALGQWASGSRQLVPRSQVFPPGKSEEEVQRENTDAFSSSEVNAEVAALDYLHQPVKVLVGTIQDGSPASSVLTAGDRLISVAGTPVDAVGDVTDALASTRPGQPVVVEYQRGDAGPKQATISLAPHPDGPQGYLGVTLRGEPMKQDEIVISLGDIVGPSAGLIFALAAVDKLTPGDLTGGRSIAGTGEITPTGDVRPIGGIAWKLRAAKDAGATVFLVPAANCAEAKQKAPDGLELIKVGTLAEAVSGLQALKDGGTRAAC
jgi:Lon-like protease